MRELRTARAASCTASAPAPGRRPRRRIVPWALPVVALLMASAASTACGEDASGGAAGDSPTDDCPGNRLADGTCFENPPRSTPPEDCPSGERGEAGICLPQPPEPPHLQSWACPEGWGAPVVWPAEEYGVPAFTFCEPPEPELDCPAGFMPLLGQSFCVRQGAECPPSGQDWADAESLRARAEGFDGDLLYVRPGTTGPRDGSRSGPFATLAEALAAAQAGDLIALAPATYTETVTVRFSLAVLGACSERTRLVAVSDDPELAVVGIGGAGGSLVRDLTISGPRNGVLCLNDAPATRLEALTIEGSRSTGISAFGPVEASDVWVRDTQDDAGGLWVVGDVEVTVRRSAFVGTHYSGVSLDDGATATLSDLIVADTEASSWSPDSGFGVTVHGGSRAVIDRMSALRNRTVGVYVSDPGTEVTLRDARVADTRTAPGEGGLGLGAQVSLDARLSLVRTALLRNQDAGVFALGGQLELEDVVIADTRPPPEASQLHGLGLVAEDSLDSEGGASRANVSATRLALLRNQYAGIVFLNRVTAELTDIVLADTEPYSFSAYGLSFEALDGARGELTLRRATILRNLEAGISLRGTDITADLEDVVVAESLQSARDYTGVGLQIQDADVTLSRAAFLDNAEGGISIIGVSDVPRIEASDLALKDQFPAPGDQLNWPALWVASGVSLSVQRAELRRNADHSIHVTGNCSLGPASCPEVQLTDLIVADTRFEEEGTRGSGMTVNGGRVSLERAAFTGNRVFSLAAQFDEVDLHLTDLTIRNTARAPSSFFEDEGAVDVGVGLSVALGARVDLQRFRIEGSQTIGLQLGPEGTLIAADGLITNNVVGLNVQQADYDVAGAFYNVLNLGNVADRDFRELGIPEIDELFPGGEPR